MLADRKTPWMLVPMMAACASAPSEMQSTALASSSSATGASSASGASSARAAASMSAPSAPRDGPPSDSLARDAARIPPPFPCEELDAERLPDGTCAAELRRLGPRDTGEMIPTHVLTERACLRIEEHERALVLDELDGDEVAVARADARWKEKLGERLARCTGSRVRAREVECYVAADSPADAAQCGDYAFP